MNDTFDLFVPGVPAPQGSMKGFIRPGKGGGKGTVAITHGNPAVVAWRMKITGWAIDKQAEYAQTKPSLVLPFAGPIGIRLDFVLLRPRGHYGTGKNASVVKPSAPEYPMTPPDLDKLVRAAFDALTDAQVWGDDAQVVWVKASKSYAGPTWPDGIGLHISMGNIK